MQVYLEVAINLPHISDTYHYHLPPELGGSVKPGSLVIVPFGSQRVQGVVLRLIETPDVTDTRPIEEVVDDKPALTPELIALAEWMADETLSSLGECIDLILPPGLSQRTDTLVHLNEEAEIDVSTLSPLEKRIVGLLTNRGDLRGRQIDASIRHVNWRGTLRKLAREGLVTTHAILPEPRVHPKTIRKVGLEISPDAVERLEKPLSRVERVHNKRLNVLELLAKEPGLVEPSWIFARTGAKNHDLKALEKEGLIRILNVQVWRDPLEETSFVQADPPELTRDQQRVWDRIRSKMQDPQSEKPPVPFLLHGVTGSGKTEIYLRAVAEALSLGKRAIVLVPEISLTPQTVKRFLARFPGRVGVVHSQLSEGERYDTWRRTRNGELSVIIGPRSALFMPLEDLGLIVVDECHHESYDQSDRSPYYRGVKTAVAFARLSGAAVLLGSATPRVTQYYQAVSGSWIYLELPKRILAHREAIAHHAERLGIELPIRPGEGLTADLGLPEVSIVDMKQELKDGNRSIFSRELHSAIQSVLDTGQQAILFLNRLGSSTYVFCRNCGHVIRCPRDDKPLTFHRSRDALLCHTCGYRRNMPKKCPVCGSDQIKQMGTGTERVEKLVNEYFPGVRTLRWDTETTRKKGAHEHILTHFSSHNADVLIGTQMLSKGLDLPLVTLVGVVLAEVGLNLPDYHAPERTFQVLTQVAGRAGRSPLGGKVVLQTYTPDDYAIQAAAQHDFTGFYSQEMAYRRDLGYPPFKKLVRLEYRHSDLEKAQNAALEMAAIIKTWITGENQRVSMIGPAPCFFQRLYGRYRWQIVLRGDDPAGLLRDRKIPDWIIEVDPSSLL